MFTKKTGTKPDVEHGVQAVSIPVKQAVSRTQTHAQPATPQSPASPSIQQGLLSQVADPAQGQPDEPVPYDAEKWDFQLTDALSVAFAFAHTFFAFYAFLIGISGEPAWIEKLKEAVVWSGIMAGIVAVNGIHNALAKRNVYYKLLQHKVVIDFQQKEPWDHPFKCLNGTFCKSCPPELTRVTSFFLLWLAGGSVVVGLTLFWYKWKVYDDNKGLTGWSRWDGGPWSFLGGAFGAALGAYSLLALYRGLEKFYEALLPFNVLMSSSKDPADRNKATAIKAWVSKCVVVPEQAFDKLAQRTIYDTKQLENAYRAQLQSQGQGYSGSFLPPCCAAVKYKRMATALHADPNAERIEEIPPPAGALPWNVWTWTMWKKNYDWFLYSTLCDNDYDSIDMRDAPTTWQGLLCCFSCGLLGKRKQSTITIVFVILVFFLTIAITAGILNTQATGTTAGCADGLTMYCAAADCAAPVCPSIYSAAAPAPLPAF